MEPNGLRTIAVTSGKGGVGKTTLSVNLAIALAAKGFRTCLFDADLGLANVDVLLGLHVAGTLEDVMFGGAALDDIIRRDVHGIDIIPGSSGIQRMADLEQDRVEGLVRAFSRLEGYSFFVMDTSAGIAKNVVAFCIGAPEVILVIHPEPAAMTDAYALLKVLHLNRYRGQVKVVISRCRSISQAKTFFLSFRSTVREFLRMEIGLIGAVLRDPAVHDSAAKRTPVLVRHPASNASRCIQHIAKNLIERPHTADGEGLSGYWTHLFEILQGPVILEGLPEDALARRVDLVASELKRIREALERLADNGGPARQSLPQPVPHQGNGGGVPLDFDAFAAGKRWNHQGA